MFCKCGCSEKVKNGNYIFGHQNRNRSPWNKGLKEIYSDETKRKWTEKRKGVKLSLSHKNKLKGRIPWNKGKTGLQKCSEEIKIKLREKMNGKKVHTEEHKQKLREKFLNGGSKHAFSFVNKEKLKQKNRERLLNGGSDYMNSFPVGKYKNHREWMLNGGAVYLIKHIKNPSKPEVKLREIVKKLYPTCEFQYQILNYVLDIAIPDYKIAIEYDGYYHFNCQENIDYHNKRQKEIEEQGWIFVRYNIYQHFPIITKVEEDINKYIN